VFFVCFLDCQVVFLYASSVVYFTFCSIAILTALNSVACTIVTCFSINTHIQIYLRDAVIARRAYQLWPCVCLSVCLSQVGVLSKLMYGSSWFWHGGILRPILRGTYIVVTCCHLSLIVSNLCIF